MAANMNKPRKNKEVKSLLPKIYVFCEGETEKIYLQKYTDKFHSDGSKRIEIKKTDFTDPINLVKTAIHEKKRGKEDDHYWVVYDREKERTEQEHQKAQSEAKDNKVNIALSNICFEMWFLWHFEETTKSFNSGTALVKSSEFRKVLNANKIQKYEKSSANARQLANNCIEQNATIAIKRAHQLNKQQMVSSALNAHPYQINPYCNIADLLQAFNFIAPTNNEELSVLWNSLNAKI